MLNRVLAQVMKRIPGLDVAPCPWLKAPPKRPKLPVPDVPVHVSLPGWILLGSRIGGGLQLVALVHLTAVWESSRDASYCDLADEELVQLCLLREDFDCIREINGSKMITWRVADLVADTLIVLGILIVLGGRGEWNLMFELRAVFFK